MKTIEGKQNFIFPNGKYQDVAEAQRTMPTWFLIVVLCCAFYILKKFIYTKDNDKHGK